MKIHETAPAPSCRSAADSLARANHPAPGPTGARQVMQHRRIEQLTAPVQRVPVNDEASLEREADRMGSLALESGKGATSAAGTNAGGLPSALRHGIESLSGMDMGGVKVHRNSAKPAQLNAHAYAQGRDIHLGPGQDKHLPHEAWHIVQQAQGRVRATMQMKLASTGEQSYATARATWSGGLAARVPQPTK